MESFDVVIVGAGPAGLKCAETLGGSGLSVLVLERSDSVGPKVCAGGLTARCFKYLDPPQSLVNRSFDSLRLHSGKIAVRLSHKEPLVFTVNREALGEWQLSNVAGFDNVEVRRSAGASSIEKECVVVSGKRIGYRFLVGADGSSSLVRRYLRLGSQKVGVALQYTLPGISHTDLEVFFSSDLFSAWYAWIFPHTNSISVGCGCDPRILPSGTLRVHFHRWLSMRGIDASKSKLEAAPLNYDYRGHRFDNIFLAGDAGGFLCGLTGEGIHSALVSGEETARAIIDPGYVSAAIPRLLLQKRKMEGLLAFLVRSGRYRRFVQSVGIAAARLPLLRKRVIRSIA